MTGIIIRPHTTECFPMEQSQGLRVSRYSNHTNGQNSSSACCLYFGGHCVPAMDKLFYSTARSACRDFHFGRFHHLTLLIIAKAAADVYIIAVTIYSLLFVFFLSTKDRTGTVPLKFLLYFQQGIWLYRV
ncbi:hypothetical protein TNCV_2522351 [Trichonephila clavipes]|nr:hypothetical protein TNCV_2522351 [Trichonephila clavipes]